MSLNTSRKELDPSRPDALTYMTFHRGVNDADAAGGFTTVVEDQASKGPEANAAVRFITSDKTGGVLQGVNVLNAKVETPEQNAARTERFFAGVWPLLHPTAYTSPEVPKAIIDFMYRAESDSIHPRGSFERLLEHVERYAPSEMVEREFAGRYRERIQDIPEGSVMRWQDFFWVHGILEHADALRAKGVHQTWHLHTSLPDSLHQSEWGKNFLHAVSKVDTFFVHTDLFKRRVEAQLEAMHLPVPKVERYDLGIERAKLDARLSDINASNYQVAIPGYQSLSTPQKEFLREVYATQETVPHRFLVVCRFDPIKGLDVVLDGIESFLQQRQAAGDDLRKEYRFFFLNKIFDYGETNPGNLSQSYGIYLSRKFQEFAARYPGVVVRGDAMTGPQRVAVPSLMWKAHGITGGRDEGLSLAIQENAYVNRGNNTSIICGTGAGIAQKVIEHGYGNSAYFPNPGRVEDFRDALHSVVRTQAMGDGSLRDRKGKMVEGVLEKCRASMIAPEAPEL